MFTNVVVVFTICISWVLAAWILNLSSYTVDELHGLITISHKNILFIILKGNVKQLLLTYFVSRPKDFGSDKVFFWKLTKTSELLYVTLIGWNNRTLHLKMSRPPSKGCDSRSWRNDWKEVDENEIFGGYKSTRCLNVFPHLCYLFISCLPLGLLNGIASFPSSKTFDHGQAFKFTPQTSHEPQCEHNPCKTAALEVSSNHWRSLMNINIIVFLFLIVMIIQLGFTFIF